MTFHCGEWAIVIEILLFWDAFRVLCVGNFYAISLVGLDRLKKLSIRVLSLESCIVNWCLVCGNLHLSVTSYCGEWAIVIEILLCWDAFRVLCVETCVFSVIDKESCCR